MMSPAAERTKARLSAATASAGRTAGHARRPRTPPQTATASAADRTAWKPMMITARLIVEICEGRP